MGFVTRHLTVHGTPMKTEADVVNGPAGAFAFEMHGRGLFFMCPCDTDHFCYIGFRGQTQPERPSWEWDGNREQPTLQPSIRHLVGCRWHGFLRAGVWEPCEDSGMWGT